jgi:long-subunit acyl-CoA synthetase (AMP-forming)
MIVDDDWDISSGLMTPTLKLRRRALVKRYGQRIAALYEDR